jgi:hypothetical protein
MESLYIIYSTHTALIKHFYAQEVMTMTESVKISQLLMIPWCIPLPLVGQFLINLHTCTHTHTPSSATQFNHADKGSICLQHISTTAHIQTVLSPKNNMLSEEF